MNQEFKHDGDAIYVQKCSDIAHELHKASILFKCLIEEVSFEVLEVYTFLKEGEKARELSKEESIDFFKSKNYENDQRKLSQIYDLKIYPRVKNLDFDLELDLGDSRLFLVCPEPKDLMEDLEETHRQINAKKALLGVIFREFDSADSKQVIKECLGKVYDEFGGKKRILLEQSEFYSPILDSYFWFSLEKEWELKNGEILENSSYAVKEGEEVGRLIKSRNGVDGRNLLGEFVSVQKREAQEIEFGSLDEDFTSEEMDDRVVYRALKDGFVGLNGSGLIMIKDFNFEEINHRNIGNLLGGIERGFEVFVKSPTIDKDAIGANIILEAEKIHISGGVDQGSILRSKKCVVIGSTHQGVEICAEYAEITTHKGLLKAKDAKVMLCEGGVVDCEKGEFEDLVGAEVSCKEAYVKNLRSNNKISFCMHFEIDQLVGGKNQFKIDSSAFGEYRDKINQILEKHHRYEQFIENALRIYQKELKKASQMKPAIQRFREIFFKNAGRGLQTQSYILGAIEQYVQMCDKLKQVKEKIDIYRKRADAIKQELEPISDLCMGAKLICHSPWVDQNQVEYFDLYQNQKENLVIEDGERVNIVIDSSSHKLIRERIQR